MKELLLCKYGEIILKGANRAFFENLLCRELKFRAARHGDFSIYRSQSTIYIEPKEDAVCDIDGMLESALKVFGIVGVSRAAVCDKDMDAIRTLAREYIPQFLAGAKTFKCEAKRSDKSFPLSSPQISAEIGGVLLSACPRLKVDVNNPDVVVRIEIREYGAYIHAGQYKGAGGMPLGSNGKGLLLLSGGIDSPVAGWMMAKRGVKLEALHFESYPYTSEQARDKVLDLAGIVAGWSGSIRVHVISLTHLQEELKRCCEEDYFTLLLRRAMMRLAERAAKEFECGALITGESVGQVASQTMEALAVTNSVVSLPVFRPCVGMDKEEIIQIARKIDTFETSILPFEDCCTVFTPRHPRTRPELSKVEAQEALIDWEPLLEEAWASMYHVNVRPDGSRAFWQKRD
ncbi:MAG: tRNA 4-thiouridine(8) synthase ThiI [Clostridia bacterium]|nr:tRNA 4-thiouridine(8) synthase ThiI [Clostridia bacterium]